MINTIKNTILLFVVFLIPITATQAKTTLVSASFTTNPAAVSGTVTVCQGQSITYTNTSTGVGTNPTYAWTFQGGSTTPVTGIGPHTITYNSSGTFSTTLTVNGTSSSVSVVVLNSPASTAVIQLVDGNFWGTSTFNGNQYFTYCSSDANTNGGLFSFTTNSTNTSLSTQHIFNWGDGQNNTYTGANLPETFHFYQNSGTFTLTYTVTNPSGCSTTKNYSIYVGASPTATINPGGIPVLCTPGSVTYNILPGAQNSPNTTYTFQVNDGSPAVVFNHPPPASYTHNYTITSCGTSSTINGTLYPNSFQASITVSNPCGTTSSAFGPINIQSPPDANFTRTPSANTICKGTTVVFNNTTTGGSNIGGAPTYTCTSNYKKYWTISGPSGNIPVTTGGLLIANLFIASSENFGYNNGQPNNSGAWLPSAANQLNITFNTPGTYVITLYTGSNTCGITSETQTICVNPEVIADFTLSPTTGCAPTTVTLDNLSSLPGCTNTNVYAWQVTHTNPQNCPNAASPGWSFTSGSASSFEPEITFTSAGVYTVQLTTSLQNAVAGPLCQPDVKTQSITIKDKPRTTLTPQTICEGTTITLNPTVFNCYATQAVTYLWDFGSNPPTSISSTTSSNPTVTFATAGTYNYTVTLTNECGSNTFSSTIYVDPAVQISASGPTATCLNTGIPLTGSITGGATTGIWTASITGGTFSPNANALSPIYTPPVNYTGTITFTLTSADPLGPCPSKIITFSVVVNAQATAEAGTYNPVCQNGSLQLNGVVGGAATSGSWTSSNGGTFSNVNSLTSTYSPPAGFTGTIVLTLTTNDPPGPCNPETDTVTITVISTPTINSISNVVVCHNGSVGPISFSGTSATNYSWTNSNPAIGLAASGTTAISFTGTNTGNAPIFGTITVTPFNTSGATSCPGTPITFTITINPRGQVNTIPGQVVCNGDSVTIANFSTTNTGGTTTYTWTSSNPSVGLTTPGNGDIPGFTANNTTTAPISTVITVTPTFENGGVSCVGTPNTITITVNPTGQVNQPNNVVFCAGTPSTSIPFTSANTIGTTTYSWTNDTLGIGLGALGTGNIPVFTPVNNTTSPILATITVIPTFTNGGKSCIGPSKTFTITINPRGQVNTVSDIIVCNGDTVSAITFTSANTGGTTTFNWVNIAPSIGLAGNGVNSTPSFTAVNNGTTPITATITVTPQYTNSITCSGAPFSFTIIVNPSAKVTTVPNKTVCNGATLAAINFATSNISGSTSYSWTNDTSSIGLAASGNGNITAFSALNIGTSPIVATIQVTPSYTNNGITCPGLPTSFTITVNPTAHVNAVANQVLCNGTSTTTVAFSTINSGGTTSYNWINSNPAIGLVASGSGTINAFNVTNITPNPIIGIITVTPSFSNGTPACAGPTQSFTITVNPSPAVTFSPTNQIICSGDTSALVTLSSTTSGATFAWTAVQPIGITGVTTSGTNTIPAQTLLNGTNAPITITYAAVASTNDASACAGITYNYTIAVKPRPNITESFTDAICSSGTFSITPANSTLNSIPIGTTYSWGLPSVTGAITGGAIGGNQTTIGGTLINPTNTVQTATYTVTPIFNGCSGSTFTVVISVNPKPFIASVTHPAICSETAFTVTPTNGSGNIIPSGTTYTWTISTNPNITGASASTTAGISTISQTLTNTSNTAQTITYTVTPTSGDSGNCVGSTFTITVVVNPKPFILATTPTICSGTAFSVTPANGSGNIVPTGTTYTWTTPISNPVGAITGGIAQATGLNTISQTLTNTTTATATLEYTVTPTSGACAGSPFTITVTVNPTPTTLGLTNQTYCNGIPTTEIVLTNGVSGTTYAWTNSNAAIGLALFGTGNIPVFTPTNSGTAPITATISIIATANNCSRVAETYTITVNPSPAVSFSPINQTICSGNTSALVTLSSTTSGATFSWTAVQPTGITGVTTSGTNTIPAQTLVNDTNAPITITYAAVAATNDTSACAGITYYYTITVTPRPSITESFTDAICSGGSFSITPVNSTLNSIPSGTTYSWSAPIVSSGITGGASGVNQTTIGGTLINSTNTVQTATYTVTPIFNSCTGTAFTVVISVNPKPAIASVTPAAICSESAFSVTPTNGSGNIVPSNTTYTWTISTNTNITGATVSTATGISTISQTLTNISNTAQTITYNVTPTSGDSGNCVGSNFTIAVIVSPKPTVLSTTPTICSGTAFSVIPTNGSGNIVPSGTTYTWTTPISNPVGAITGGIAQATGLNTISQTLTNTTTATATLEYTVTPTSGACAGTPFTITVMVNPTPTTLGLTNQTYCNGAPTTEIVLTNGVSGTTYAWTNSNPAIGLAASGTGNIPVFTPTNSTIAPITGTISIIATANGCSRVAETYIITVNPSPAVSFSPTNQIICSGDTSALVTLSSTTSGATFAWTAVQPTGITGVTTSGTNTIPGQTLVNTTNVPITITYAAVASTNDASACAGSIYNYTITVTPRPNITESFTNEICSGGTFSITPANSTLNSIPTGTTYSWGLPSVTGAITGGAIGFNQTTIGGTLINPTNTVQTATYTVTPSFNGCSGSTFTVVINVNPKPAIANVTHPAICSETAFTVTPTNGSGNIVPSNTTYTWTISTNANITGASASTAAGISTISQTLTNTSNTAQTITYTVTPTSGDSGNCVGSTFTITVVVNPKPFILATTPTICSGTAFSVTPANGSGNIVSTGTTYTWTTPISNPVGAITGGIAQATGLATISQTLTNTTTAPATLEYTVTPTSGACAGTTFTITVTVNPTPTTLGLTNQTYCNGAPTTEIVLTNGVSGTTYAWTNSNPAIGLAASGNGNIPVFTPTNSGTAPITATISIIATANGCSRVAETYIITVNPSPAVTFSPSNQTICSGDTSALVNLSSTTSGAIITWTATQPAGITGISNIRTNIIPEQILVNSTNAPITITYSATATTNDASACAGITYNYTITVNPRPAIENQAFVICSEQGFTVAPINGVPNANTIVPTGTTYTWTISANTNITGASAGTGNQISQVLTNTSTTIQTIIYTVTPTAGTCIGNPFTITVEVYPKPNVIFDLANQTICNNTATSLVTLSSSLPGALTYAWTANIPIGISGAIASGTNTIPVQTLVNSTNSPLNITYTAAATFTSNGNSCTGNNTFYTITVNPTFTASGVLSNYNGYNVSVFGGNDGTINLTVAGGDGGYTYNWVGPNGFTATTEDLNGLFAGTYTVTINDGYCAPIVLTFTLTQPPELLVQQDLALNINLICFGNSNGAVGIQITQESVSPYDYTLLNSANAIVQTITNSTNLNPQFTGLIAGTYSVLVTDANGGTKTVTGLVVSQPNDIVITPTITEITCYGANNASISLAVTGGTATYQANWSNLATGFYQNNLAAGSYTITITDANGCPKQITINIIEAPIFTINPVVTNISCFGANNGSINLNLIGGQAPVTLTWSDGSTSGTVRNNLLPGTYSVSISDGTPCYINRTFIIVEPQPLVLNATVQNALDCLIPTSGAINLVVSGGTPPFTYAWSNGATTEDLTAITNGNYSVIVTDSRGCIKTASYTVFRPQPLIVVLDQNSQVNCATGTVTNLFKANVSGGMAPFTINWSSGTISGTNNEFMSTTQNGLITVTITDANGCTTSQSVTISNPIIGNAGFGQNSFAYTTYGIYSINDPIQFTNTATGDFVSVAWNFGDGIFSTEENPIHTYVLEGNYIVTQTVTYPLGCIKTTIITLIITKGYKLIIPSGFTANDDTINDTFKPEFEGLENISLQVYDTWGNVVYYEKGETIVGWNGQINSVPAENGNYYYKVIGTTFYGELIEKSGPFTLIK